MRARFTPRTRAMTAAFAATACALALLPAAPTQAAGRTKSYELIVAATGRIANDTWAGTPTRPLRTLAEAQRRARKLVASGNVFISLTDGVHRLARPLVLTTADSGRNGHTITWRNRPGAAPVISGGQRVTGWRLHDRAKNIYVADVPTGLDSRQLYVDGALAARARISVARTDLTPTLTGLTIKNPKLNYLADLTGQSRIEVESVAYFTDRYAPVQAIDGTTITMQQPAWRNNIWGYDTLQHPFITGSVYLANSLSFLTEANQWYLDPVAGEVYYKPLPGKKITASRIELPRLSSLVQIAGTYAQPIHDVNFRGLHFAHTSWLGPSSPQGYANQQSGTFLTGTHTQPADPLTACAVGCPDFEATRPGWNQMPAAVQVAAARRITFTGNTFSQLGQIGLGIGNDANANASGIGLGATAITVDHNKFTELAGGGIVVGGIRADAHHPSDARMTNADIVLRNNLVTDVAKDYKECAGILSTYVTRAVIDHNEVRNVPYDGIDIGWGWGSNDPGGSQDYVNRGLYKHQPIYTTPTTFKNNVVTNNLIHDTKQVMADGGSLYALSASPGTVMSGNYMYDNRNTIGLYLDEGSRYITVRNNVVQDPGAWAFTNANATNNTNDNVFRGNWYNGGGTWVDTGPLHKNVLDGNVAVRGYEWPMAAQQVIYQAGVQPALRDADTTNPEPVGLTVTAGNASLSPAGTTTLTATVRNFGAIAATHVAGRINLSAGWTATPLTTPAGGRLRAGAEATLTWRITAPKSFSTPISSVPVGVVLSYRVAEDRYSSAGSATVRAINPLESSLSGYGSVPSQFAQSGNAYAIVTAGADVWEDAGGKFDQYGAIYRSKAAGPTATVTARVTRMEKTNDWAKAGVVLRNDLTAAGSSPGYASMVVTPSNGVSFQWDSNGNGYADSWATANATAPVWVRLVRDGTKVSGYYSTDGTAWTQVGSAVTLTGAADKQDAGVLATSHNAGVAGQFDFSDLTVTSP